MENASNLKIAFFGTPELARIVLEELAQAGILPTLVVTNPDAPVGRKAVITAPPAKVWAHENDIPVIQPASLRDATALLEFTSQPWDLFIVAAYGKLIPQWLLDIPKHGTLNVHPSLLPKLRGASPIRSAILQNIRNTGVSIMVLDAELDHGPIVVQMNTDISAENWPVPGLVLEEGMAHQGGALLASIIPDYVVGKLTPTAQNHDEATFCTKIEKSMSELAIDPHNLPAGNDAYQMLLKIRAFDGWPETFFMYEGKRIKIKHAGLSADGTLLITRIVPEGKNETDFEQYFEKN
jgi:methionyl-tRNA formyltransferase